MTKKVMIVYYYWLFCLCHCFKVNIY